MRSIFKKKVPIVYQSENSECGLACILMVLGASGRYLSLQNARQKYQAQALGTTANDLCLLAGKVGFTSKVFSVDLEELMHIETPVIIHWEFKHFVVLTNLNMKEAIINDPALGIRNIPIASFSDAFTGVVIELTPTSKILSVGDGRQKTILSILKPYKFGLGKNISKYLLLASLGQTFALLFPLLYHVIIDRVINYGDKDLLDVIALFLVGFCFFHAATNWIKAKEEIFLSGTVGYRFYGEMGDRLVRASAKFFESRRPQFITSTMTSSRSIEKSLNGNFLGSTVDAIFSLVIIGVLLLLDYRFFLIVLIGIIIYILLAVWFYQQLNYVESEHASNLANERNNLTEFISNYQVFKVYTTEREIFQNLMDDHKASNISIEHISRLNISYKVVTELISYLIRIAVVYFAAKFSIEESFSIGFLFCIFIYCNLLITRLQAMIDVSFSARKLSEKYSKIEDLIYSERPDLNYERNFSCMISGSMGLKNVYFSLSPTDKPILKDISLTILPGQLIAIYGNSGCGKSTLMKIMAGFYRPTKGDFVVEGSSIKNWNMDEYRSQISVIFQTERIIPGSILKNITMFDKNPDLIKVIEIAKNIGLDEIIQKLPMKYETSLRDGDGVFSGGQRQQVLIARALYKSPKVLFMDEGTVYIDKKLKRKILDYITRLNITIVVATHEAEYLDYADNVVEIKNGMIISKKINNEMNPEKIST